MNFNGNFNHICDADVSPIQKLVNNLTEKHWALDISRQQKYDVHEDTATINLVHDPDFRHMNPSKHPALDVFGPVIQPVLAYIAQYYENKLANKTLIEQYGAGYFIRANIIKLKAGGTISAHQDKNFSLAHSHRIHIPIVTHEDVHFTVGDETVHIPVGEVVEINNRRFHSVSNNSEIDRVHLILDFVVPGEPCCCADKTHPGELCTPESCQATDRLMIPCYCHP
ncbi:aspartyl/asparaginyl beta-hydroxylase domain-containing protein [Marinicella litoralis]|uniref:Aspartyl/asparaginyl beta-hydroxylase n=1 Tax=Marinicella litoralis TaxID=644220 RepID=A0A4V6PXS6_9GAMM|nr:aspartyl/asparaginyl beta-hydroxylase domain-containing protein [Marinicella litoralis]TDR16321.1 aspartyl/asparaginyl beta-hydroxylase [Marinicella litoralis]